MIVSCPACSSRYRIREDRIQGRGARITCPNCSHKFVVYRDQGNAPVEPEPSAYDEEDESDVPTTVMPQGSSLARSIRENARVEMAAGTGPATAPTARGPAKVSPPRPPKSIDYGDIDDGPRGPSAREMRQKQKEAAEAARKGNAGGTRIGFVIVVLLLIAAMLAGVLYATGNIPPELLEQVGLG